MVWGSGPILMPYGGGVALCQTHSLSESFMERLLSRYSDIFADSDADYTVDALVEYYTDLLFHPLNLNRASKDDLESLMLLSPFQVESLMDYRRTKGSILSFEELSFIAGFSEELTELLKPFVSIEWQDNYTYKGKGSFSDLFVSTSVKESQASLLLKYKGAFGNRFSAGVTAENDAGEQLFPSLARAFDFISFHIAAKELGKVRRFVAGDFSARFGQGLVLWKAFPMNGSSSSFYKRGNSIVPYTSSVEENFLRGAAVTFAFGRSELSVLFSYNKVDAAIEEKYYTSLPSGGLHNTINSLQRRRQLGESLAGLRYSCNFGRVQAAINYATYRYDKKNGRRVNYYNSFQMYDGLWGNISVSLSAFAGRSLLFGEFAVDYGGTPAFVAGVERQLKSSGEFSFMVRHYPASYIAPHAGAYSSKSGCYNQSGLSLGYTRRMKHNMVLESFLDAVIYPKPRYNIKGGSCAVKCKTTLSYNSIKRFSAKGGLSAGYYSATSLSKGSDVCRFSLSGSCKWFFSFAELTLKTALGLYSCNGSTDCSTAAGVHIKKTTGKFSLHGGATLFHVPLWSNRLYLYESDIPYTFAVRGVYGRGVSYYLMAQYNLFRKLSVYARCGVSEQKRSGDETKNLATLKFAARLRF